MLLAIWIRLNGGFWAYRMRLEKTSNPVLRHVRKFVYTHYLEYLGSYIALSARFAGPPKFPHKPMGVFIAPKAEIGKNVTIYQQVTIGSNETAGSKGFGSPLIGDDVFLGSGAKIIGNVRLGTGATVGAGAVVVKDVPDGGRAVSPAARVL